MAEDVSEHWDPQKEGRGFRKLQKSKKKACIFKKGGEGGVKEE